MNPKRLKDCWKNMIRRCTNTTSHQYHDYGGRGITVCKEWLNSFQKFELWALSNGYNDNLTIERSNNNLGYSPSNCIWVDMSHQMANRRINKNSKSPFIGVDKLPSGNWRAKIKFKGKVTNLGVFPSAKAAADARVNFIIQHNLPHTRSN